MNVIIEIDNIAYRNRSKIIRDDYRPNMSWMVHITFSSVERYQAKCDAAQVCEAVHFNLLKVVETCAELTKTYLANDIVREKTKLGRRCRYDL